MDNSHGAFDGIVLKACPTPSPYNSSYIESPSLTKPRPIGNMQLSHAGLFDRIKCEDMASDVSGMFSRAAAAQLYERAHKNADTLLYGAYAGAVDLRGVRSAATPSCVPAYNVMDFIASSNSFNFLASANAEQMGPSTNNASSISMPMNGLGMHAHLSAEHEKKPFEKTMTTPSLSRLFKKTRPQEAMEGAHQSQTSKFRGQSASNLPTEFNSKSLQPHDQYLKSPSDHFSPDILDPPLDSPISPNSPSKQDSALSGAEDGDTDWSKAQSPSSKRRKTQQKRVVFVPVGDAKQLKGESPPSDLWAWRKYGQKPIKGSPYPRGYYRCSSSKGCSARKQVERSCTDPTMLIVTYTSEHNHAWPISKAASAANPQSTLKPIPDSRDKCEDQSEETATTSSSCDVVNENLFSTIINSVSAAGEPVVSSLDTLQEEESFCLKRDVDLCFLSRPSMTEEDGVFDDLGELPEMSAIFSEGYNFEDLYRYVY